MITLKKIFLSAMLGALSILLTTKTFAESFETIQYTPPPPAYTMSSVYNRPYSFTENNVNTDLLKRNTVLLFGTGIATMGFLYLMPSSFTNWEDDGESPFSKWWDNVSGGPVVDKDDFFLNYVTHPYAGAIYYMGARSAGANAFYSFLYSFALSTFFWECGIEAFAEKPSIQDLIITPVFGAFLGEWFYASKRHIKSNDEKLLDSRFLGKSALFLMDPITEVTELIWAPEESAKHNFSVVSYPTLSGSGEIGYQVRFSFSF